MPVKLNKTVHIKDAATGAISILTEKDEISESNDIHVECDSNRCASRHDGKTTTIEWNMEEVKGKPDALPNGFFRMLALIVNPTSQEQKIFCSPGCVRDFLQYQYQAPLSPAEIAILQQNNQHAEAAKHRPNVVKFPAPAVAPTVDKTVVDPPLPIEPNLVGSEGVEGPEGAPFADLDLAIAIQEETEKAAIKNGSDLDLA